MSTSGRRTGFTAVDVLVVTAVIAVLVAILSPALSYAQHKIAAAKCASHVSQIAMAVKMYYDDHHFPPGADLRSELADYIDSPEVFVCPEDYGGIDSYSGLYVSRPSPAGEQYVVRCPFHGNQRQAIMLSAGGIPRPPRRSRWSGLAQRLNSGDVAEGGEVPKGTAFEVMTPAAIAGVRDGATFAMQVGTFGGKGRGHAWGTRRQSVLQGQEGQVLLEDRFRNREQRLGAGETAYMSVEESRLPKDPNWPPGKGKK